MAWSSVCGLALVLAILVVLSVVGGRWMERMDEDERRREAERLRDELRREIEACGNLNRIASLRRRLLELTGGKG